MAAKMRTRDALIMGREAVVAERQPAPKLLALGPAGRLNHGLQGPHVKALSCEKAPKSQEQLLRDAWANFLSAYKFQWFATLTFETNVHPEAALKRWRFFTNQLNRALYGRRWQKKEHGGIYWILGIEYQKRGVIHFHALMGAINDLNEIASRLSWMDYWNELAGFARIEAIRSNEAALRYVTKYVVKGGDIEFSRNLGDPMQQTLPGV